MPVGPRCLYLEITPENPCVFLFSITPGRDFKKTNIGAPKRDFKRKNTRAPRREFQQKAEPKKSTGAAWISKEKKIRPPRRDFKNKNTRTEVFFLCSLHL